MVTSTAAPVEWGGGSDGGSLGLAQNYAQRKGLAESPFGWVKMVMGFRQFSVRGIEKIKGEWQLVCAALDLRRLSTQMQWA